MKMNEEGKDLLKFEGVTEQRRPRITLATLVSFAAITLAIIGISERPKVGPPKELLERQDALLIKLDSIEELITMHSEYGMNKKYNYGNNGGITKEWHRRNDELFSQRRMTENTLEVINARVAGHDNY